VSLIPIEHFPFDLAEAVDDELFGELPEACQLRLTEELSRTRLRQWRRCATRLAGGL